MKGRLYRESSYLFQLLIRLFGVLCLFSGIRLLFFGHHQSFFPDLSYTNFLSYNLLGLRFDWAAITYINALFIIGSLLPIAIRTKAWYQRLLLSCYLLFNGLALLFELADIAWFRFAFRRSISSDFHMLEKSANLIPQYISEFGICYWCGWHAWPFCISSIRKPDISS